MNKKQPARLDKKVEEPSTIAKWIVFVIFMSVMFIVLTKLLIWFGDSCRAENYYNYIGHAVLSVMRCY